MQKKSLPTVQTPYGLAVIELQRYSKGGSVAVCLSDAVTGEPIATISCNLPYASYRLKPDEMFVKGWSENEPLVQPLLDTGLFKDIGVVEPTGFVHARVWRISEELLEQLMVPAAA